MSNDSPLEQEPRISGAVVKQILGFTESALRSPRCPVTSDCLLAALEEPYAQALEAADDDGLDEELTRLGFDPEAVTARAGAFRKRLHEEFLLRVGSEHQSSDPPEGCQQVSRKLSLERIGTPWTRGSKAGSSQTSRTVTASTESVAPEARRRMVVVLTSPCRVAEMSSVRGNLHRLMSPTGLASRIGLVLDVEYLEHRAPMAFEAWVHMGEVRPDVVVVCGPETASPDRLADRLRLWSRAIRDGGRQPPEAPSIDPGGRPRILDFIPINGGAKGVCSDGMPQIEALAIRQEAGEPEIDTLLYEDDRDFNQVCQRVLALWMLDVRLELIYGQHRLPHPVAPECTTLCISLVGGKSVGDDPAKMSDASVHLWNRVGALIGHHGGMLGCRFLDIGFFHFGGEERHRRAVEAGRRLVREAAVIRGADEPSAGWPQFLRLAIHDLPEHSEERTPEGFGFLLALAESPEVDQGFALTAPVVDSLPPSLQSSFRIGGRFCGVPFSTATQVTTGSAALIPSLSIRDLDDLTGFGVEMEAAASASGAPQCRLLQAVDAAVDRFYAMLETCCRRLDEELQWREAIGPDSLRIAERILKVERRVWGLVEQLSSRSIAEGGDGSWRAPLYIAAARRASLVTELERTIGVGVAAESSEGLLQEGTVLGSRTRAAGPTDREMLKTLRLVLQGDELDAYTGFIELTSNFKVQVVRYLRDPAAFARLEDRLRARLWDLVEFVIAEDASENDDNDRLLLPAIMACSIGDSRFQALSKFLCAGKGAARKPEDELRAHGAVVSPGHAQKLWQGQLLTAEDPIRCRDAAEQLRWDALWPVLIYPRTPLFSIAAIATRFAEVRFERYGQICLDCVAPRLKRTLESESVDGRTLSGVRGVVEAFSKFRFSAGAGSFERLGVILDLYRERCTERGLETGRPWEELLSLESSPVASSAESEALLTSLPLVVQRHLAREGLHLEFFVCHPSYRIARETLRHIRPDRVERLVALNGINALVLLDLLRTPGMFARSVALETVLRHPKCAPTFAAQKLARLGRAALLRVIRAPGANSTVRGQAEALLKVRAFPSSSVAPSKAGAGDRH